MNSLKSCYGRHGSLPRVVYFALSIDELDLAANSSANLRELCVPSSGAVCTGLLSHSELSFIEYTSRIGTSKSPITSSITRTGELYHQASLTFVHCAEYFGPIVRYNWGPAWHTISVHGEWFNLYCIVHWSGSQRNTEIIALRQGRPPVLIVSAAEKPGRCSTGNGCHKVRKSVQIDPVPTARNTHTSKSHWILSIDNYIY